MMESMTLPRKQKTTPKAPSLRKKTTWKNFTNLSKLTSIQQKQKKPPIISPQTFFKDNPFKIHKTYPSIFKKCDQSDTTGIRTPSRIFKPPSSFSTPKFGTPKRSRSESPINEVNGIISIKFSDNAKLLDMNHINPTNTYTDELHTNKEPPKASEELT